MKTRIREENKSWFQTFITWMHFLLDPKVTKTFKISVVTISPSRKFTEKISEQVSVWNFQFYPDVTKPQILRKRNQARVLGVFLLLAGRGGRPSHALFRFAWDNSFKYLSSSQICYHCYQYYPSIVINTSYHYY